MFVFIFFFVSVVLFYFFFFFSSRRRHTRYIGDWSSDVCSSDLWRACWSRRGGRRRRHGGRSGRARPWRGSEERRVGKECRSRWSPDHYKTKIVAKLVDVDLREPARRARQYLQLARTQ